MGQEEFHDPHIAVESGNRRLRRARVCPISAEATVGSVTVNTSRPFEQGDDYTYAEITIQGTVARPDGSVGSYSVPAVLIYPRMAVGTRSASSTGSAPPSITSSRPRQSSGGRVHSPRDRGRPLEEGYTYLSIQWNKAVTEIFGPAAPSGRAAAQPPRLRIHRAGRRCVGDPAAMRRGC